MSLKSFHIVFISVSVLLSIGFGGWFLSEQPMAIDTLNVAAALLSFSFAGLLLVYEKRFLKKFKHISYL